MLIESRDFSYRLVFDAPVGPSWIVIPFGMNKTTVEWCGYCTVKKFEYMFRRFVRTLACDRQTDRQKILPQRSPHYAYASYGKNELICS